MKTRVITPLILTSSLLWSANSLAASTIGLLSWDGTPDGLITNTVSGVQYANLAKFAGVSYSDLTTQLSSNPLYSGYHVASESEFLDFYNGLENSKYTYINGYYDKYTNGYYNGSFTVPIDGLLGDNSSNSTDIIFSKLPSGFSRQSPVIALRSLFFKTGEPYGAHISYKHSYTSDIPRNITVGNASYLVVAGSSVSSVPIPTSALMFAPALLGFAALRRKNSA